LRQKTKQAGSSATVGRQNLPLVVKISAFLEAWVHFYLWNKNKENSINNNFTACGLQLYKNKNKIG
jgi:hypothetical protein